MTSPSHAHTIQTYFEGDAALFESYLAACLLQFGNDRLVGDQACELGDLPGLRRVSHNLKTVLQTVGYAEMSGVAHDCEVASHNGETERARKSWVALSAALQKILTSSPQPSNR